MKTSQEDVPYGLVSETTTDPKGNTVEKWYDSLDKMESCKIKWPKKDDS